ncbi:MAG TPA: type II secretion system minor pseudopilin GspI [Smithellaceae bacterium]|nr:type II secretion system minor pseudopilin GspI [Smithella sp.]HOQ41461.1 type II secretion system minor pseudopilin GspI [Smithellaceae bacterium]
MLYRKAGFTLLEVMVAMSILAMALVAVFYMQSQSISMAGEARFLTTASLLAQHKMTEIEADTSMDNKKREGDFAPDYPAYGWTTEVTDTKIAKLKKIEVNVFNKVLTKGGNYQLVLYRTGGN